MNKTIKTYGVSGLMDWTVQIRVGKGSVSVHFTGGALTAYGVTPAKYSTSDPFFQHVIEGSDVFKSGRIRLLDVKESASSVPPEKAPSSSEAVSVCVANKYDAIEYLKEHYPDKRYSSTHLRTNASFDAACKECGVTFVFAS